MSTPSVSGFPPASVSTLLRLEGLGTLAVAVTVFAMMGGNWWLFALLLLAPDLSMLGGLAGPLAGSRFYNAAHTYVLPGILAAVGWVSGTDLLLQVALIWVAHIGMDRALGYGLKYPGQFHATHIGAIGKMRKDRRLANAG